MQNFCDNVNIGALGQDFPLWDPIAWQGRNPGME